MARTILPLAGAVVGSFFGAPQLGYAIGSIVGNAVDPQRIKGPRVGDANLQTSQEGAPRPIVYGKAAVMGNLIDRGPLNKVITEERQGKGGPVVETESLYMTFAIRICEGPIDGVSRIWEDERLVYDVRPESTILDDSLKYGQGFTLYLGSEDQLPDPDLEVIHGIGNTPAHRGTAYIVFTEKNLTDRRGSIPQFRFEVNGCVAALPPTVGPIRWAAYDTDGLVNTYNLPVPAGTQAGDLVIVAGHSSEYGGGHIVQFLPADAAFEPINGGNGDFAGRSYTFALTADIGMIGSGIALEQVSETVPSPTTAQEGGFIVYSISASLLKTPFNVESIKSGISYDPPSLAFSFPESPQVIALSFLFLRGAVTATSYPFPSSNIEKVVGDGYLAACHQVVENTGTINPAPWTVSPGTVFINSCNTVGLEMAPA